MQYDIVIFGNYTKDTIVSPAGTRYVDGGGFNYGAHVCAMMGLKTAAVTRLAREDERVVTALRAAGIDAFPTFTPTSTHMRLYYPGSNPDERTLTATQLAGPFTPEQFKDLNAKFYLANASTRGEVGLDVILALKRKGGRIVVDAQGFVRTTAADGTLIFDSWPGKEEILPHVDILKTDHVEATSMRLRRLSPAGARRKSCSRIAMASLCSWMGSFTRRRGSRRSLSAAAGVVTRASPRMSRSVSPRHRPSRRFGPPPSRA